MTENQTVPAAIVEKAAKALDAWDFPDEGWEGEGSSAGWREWCRGRARAALEAVYADIQAEALREAAGELTAYQPQTPTPTLDAAVAKWLNARADRLAGA